jgi:small subunit ribosomal protein S3
MGHKVNPVGFRMGVTRQADAKWYANKKDYSIFLHQDMLIRDYLEKSSGYSRAYVSKITIIRDGVNVRVNMHAARPAVLIGKSATTIDKYARDLRKKLGVKETEARNFKIHVLEVKKSHLNSKQVSLQIKEQLERRVSYRRCMKKALQEVMKAGALGVKIQISGRLSGAEIARSESVKDGKIPLHTISADIDYATSEALTTYGILGVKVWIYNQSNQFEAEAASANKKTEKSIKKG